MRTVLLFPLLLGCAYTAQQIDPPLGQLARWRGASLASIAAEPVLQPCPADNAACAPLHVQRAEACMTFAMAARARGAACPDIAELPHLRCAAEGYQAAMTGAADPLLAANAAHALLCRAELSPPAQAAADAARAEALAPEQPVLGTWAAMLLARLGPPDGRCEALGRATRRAALAPPSQQVRLGADLALLRARIPGCAA